ncbi:MAG: class I SAM-dependent methyltransferase [Candidatus Woesebacteria bacterium]|nr:MAG: class I SAM-dependent methyltransferase [Candidatus Woesebacteria bacterium]
MKLIDALKHKGKPFEIPDSSRNELPEFFKQLGFKTGAEIGVFTGRNLVLYCHAGLTMYGIDPWASYQGYRAPRRLEDMYLTTIKRIAQYSNCSIIRKTSMDALLDIQNNSLDFVYIDANHTFGYVAMDLMKWYDKVKSGGIIAGHDYHKVIGSKTNGSHTNDVTFIIEAFVKAKNITNWYILGREKSITGRRVDDILSYMFFKP